MVRRSRHSLRSGLVRVSFLCVSLTVTAGVRTAFGQSFSTDAGMVRFTSSVPLHTFDGTSDQLVGRINSADSTVDFYLDLSTLKTGIGKRDKDMRKTLEVEEHPFAEFYGSITSNFDWSKSDTQSVIVEGAFSLHGITRSISVSGVMTHAENRLHLRADWQISLGDFDIEPPSLLVMKVDEIQKVHIEANLDLDESLEGG